jgi:hypothetical protein
MHQFLQRAFHRNIQAQANLELLLISAASSLLLLRFTLYLSGYPQVGGRALHIAHVLYGGLFMLAAIVIQTSFLGKRAQRVAAVVGGAGFGIFIDELGKFVTRDNNYFFQPTIGIIYAIFMILYLLFNFLGRQQKLSSRAYQLNALEELQEAVLQDMDAREKQHVHLLLDAADQNDPITKQLQHMLQQIEPVDNPNSRLARLQETVSQRYRRFWQLRASSQIVSLVFIVEALIFVIIVFTTLGRNLSVLDTLVDGKKAYGNDLLIGQLASSLVAAIFAIIGAVKLPRSRDRGFEWFRRATLVTIFLTEFFIFTRIQFGALPGFILNVLLLGSLNFAIYQERRSLTD